MKEIITQLSPYTLEILIIILLISSITESINNFIIRKRLNKIEQMLKNKK